MTVNLDTLKEEIQARLEAMGFIVFHGYRRHGEHQAVAYWDTRRGVDYQAYLDTAQKCGVKMVVFHWTQFRSEMVEDALDRLEDCDMPRDEHGGYERRLREMKSYHGFTCALELTYDFEGCTYGYDVQAAWYREFLMTLDELEDYLPEPDDDGGEDESMGGFLSRN
jgi:hypothetical protein